MEMAKNLLASAKELRDDVYEFGTPRQLYSVM